MKIKILILEPFFLKYTNFKKKEKKFLTLSRTRYQYTKETLKDLLFDYNALPNVLPASRPKSVEIWDETLRDGEQTPGVFLTLEEEVLIVL